MEAAGGAAGADAAGEEAAGGLAAGAGAAAAGDAGFAETALTAVRQAGESLAEFFCRHWNASVPPGVTPEQFDMKSDRHELRIAFC